MVDEVQEYFDATVITPFLNQARKRNISCIFAHQRLSQLDKQEVLRDALTGVGTLIATNVNENDIREVSKKFRVEQEQVYAWRKEYIEKGRDPAYADFGFFLKGKSIAETFRLTYLQLEKLKPSKKQERTEEAPRYQQQEPPRQERPAGPPNDDAYDDRYDILERKPLSPVKARDGTVFRIKLPNNRDHLEPIPAGTKNGYRFCVKGVSPIRRPDNKNGNFWVELEIAEWSGPKKEDF
jgi:transposase-like protein